MSPASGGAAGASLNRRIAWALAGLFLLVSASLACGGQARSAPEPDKVVVQHLLVSFAGKLPGKVIARTQSQARDLVHKLLERARAGEDFDALVKQYTDDQHPGVYTMMNLGGAPGVGEYGREQMVPGFGDASFHLQVGEIGVCDYDGVRSPFGYHIIKRIQ
jgi:PPIC-type PPIASE domain